MAFLSRLQLLASDGPATNPVVGLVHHGVEIVRCVLHGITRIAYPSLVVPTAGTLPLPFASGDGKLGCNCVVSAFATIPLGWNTNLQTVVIINHYPHQEPTSI